MGFLTESELEFFTDLKQPAAQIRFLQRKGISHEISAAGRPKVTWDAVNRREVSGAEWQPNLSLLDKAG